MISHALIQIYVRNINGYCAKLALNVDAKVGPLTLSDSRQHKNVFIQFS